MKQKCILIWGATISRNPILISGLQKCGNVQVDSNSSNIYSIIQKSKIDLALIEISSSKANDIELIHKLTTKFRQLKIILINGDGDNELIAKAFQYGIVDAFRKPCKDELIVERVRAVLK